jgi:hypothetical protein
MTTGAATRQQPADRVPDLRAVASMMVNRQGWFTPPHGPWLGVTYGGQKDESEFHKTGFTAPRLRQRRRARLEAGLGACDHR